MNILKVARIKKDLTQADLAKNLNMSVATINKIENSIVALDSVKLGTLKKICKAIDLTNDEFISLIKY